MPRLTHEDREKYSIALKDAFVRTRDLHDLYRRIFDKDITRRHSANASIDELVDGILTDCEAQSKLDKLIPAALEINPDNELLKALLVVPSSKASDEDPGEAGDKNPENVIGFVNRKKELDSIFLTPGQSSRYWVVDAPAGYGKSQLLDEAIKKYAEDEWLTVKIVFPRHADGASNAEPSSFVVEKVAKPIISQLRGSTAVIGAVESMDVVGMEIAASILAATKKVENRAIKGIAILVDNFEGCPSEDVLGFAQMMSGIFTGLKNNNDFFQSKYLRVFIAGRYARNKIKVARDQIMLVEMPLAAFTFDVMVDSIENFAISKGKSSGFPQARDIAAHLMFITGGHPGFVAEILADLAEDDFAMGIYPLVRNARQYQEKFTEKFYSQLIQESPRLNEHSLIDILSKLSPFRKYDRWFFLKELRDRDHLPKDLSEETLEKGLLSTYLVDRQGGFLHDGIYRYLLEIKLRIQQPALYAVLCSAGIDIYKKYLSGTPSIRNIEKWAVEFIYLNIVENYHVKNMRGDPLAQSTKENLLWVIDRLAGMKADVSVADIENVREDFLKELNDDDELRFLYAFGTAKEDHFDSGAFEDLLNYANQEFDRLL